MQVRHALLLAFAVLAQCDAGKVTPVEKVIQLLEKLGTQVTAEGKEEAVAYDKYACFCKDQADGKQYAIEKSTKEIEEMDAKIKDLEGQIKELASDIEELEGEIEEHTKTIASEKKARQALIDAYEAANAQREANIDAVERAIKALKNSKKDMGGDSRLDAEMFVQTMIKVGQMEPGQPAQFQYSSNTIIETLQKVRKTFVKAKDEADKDFINKKAVHDKKIGAEQTDKKLKQETVDYKIERKTEKEEEKKEVEENRRQEEEDKTADGVFLKELTATCEEKAKLWDQRSSKRSDELKAIQEAIDILKEGVKPNYGANKELVGLQTRKGHWEWVPASFLQLESNGAIKSVLAVLSRANSQLNSANLIGLMAKIRLSSGADHFAKVRGIIKDLVTALKKQAEEDAKQKSVCDKMIGDAVKNRDKAQADLETEQTKESKAEDEIARLKDLIQDRIELIATTKKEMAEMLVLRKERRLDNEQVLAESKAGKEAVVKAQEVLSKFYGFTQYVPENADREGKTVGDLAPEIFDDEYAGKEDASKGILGLLDVIVSDFTRTIKDTTAEEKRDAEETDKKEAEMKATIETAKKEKKQAEADLVKEKKNLLDAKAAIKDAEVSLKDEKETLADAKKMCVDGESWEDRAAARKAEIEALKEAHNILENWKD